ncbi:regulatory protein RecX [Proteus cibarius]|uniref:Regulatory protein RecX n=1 Tax=Proteus terrae subsp. cibarius TaxID=626774 RepID=A0A6G6T0C1_9GAMM|nr:MULTISPECIES: regulatory protein RecX [Proteus]MDY3696670.1 regulatory protein RecX [Proteus mirabilis]QHP77828.1 regulatory protein RecX [Proteus vulgaris]MBG2915613.1 regulatory protein RecX [Proteus terrae subsp. cibarius]MBG3091734.1 regulatory protein RecX [Proteus terrae subsp. cibarius]MBG6038611.1 regulatory protein RecX [Proteus terrae subsp. cibarius]
MTYQELYQYAIFMLSRRDYSTSELQRRIERRIRETEKDSPTAPECLPQVIERLLESQYLDDNRTIYSFFRSYLNKSYGPLRIRQELRLKGFPSEIIERVLEETDTDWYALCQDLKEKKFGTAKPKDFKERAKQIRYLQYRGFTSDYINALF